MTGKNTIAGLMAAILVGWGGLFPAAQAAGEGKSQGVEEDEWAGLPPGPGREEVFFLCQACHSLALVKQQGLSKGDWDETITWMVEEQEMEPPESDERTLLVAYLAAHYGTDRKKRR